MTGRVKEYAGLSLVVLVVGLILVCAHARAAQPGDEVTSLARICPPETLAYLSVRNPVQREDFRDSALGHLASREEMRRFLDNAGSECRRLLERYRGRIPLDPALLGAALQRELSVAFTGMAAGPSGRMEPGLVVSAVFDESPESVEEMLLEALPRRGRRGRGGQPDALRMEKHTVRRLPSAAGRVYYTFLGPRLLLSTSEAAMTTCLQRVAGTGESLAATEKYRMAARRVGGLDGMLSLYIDAESIFQQYSGAIPADAREALNQLGVFQIKTIALASRFDDGGIRDRVFLHAPGRRTGFLPRAGERVDTSLLDLAPEGARTLALFRSDPGRFYDSIMAAVRSSDQEQFQRLQRDVRQAEEQLGFNIRQDLLGSIGQQCLFFQARDETVLLLEVTDRDRLQECIRNLVEQAQGDAVLERIDYHGTPIHYLAIKAQPLPLCPAFSFIRHRNSTYAVVGLYPQTLKTFLSRRAEGTPSITSNEDFERVTRGFQRGAYSLSYQEVGPGISDFYSLLTVLSPMLHGVEEASLKPELLPSPRVLREHLFGLGARTVSREDGLLYEAYSPVGSAGNLLAAVGSLRTVGRLTGVKALSLPAISAMLMRYQALAIGRPVTARPNRRFQSARLLGKGLRGKISDGAKIVIFRYPVATETMPEGFDEESDVEIPTVEEQVAQMKKNWEGAIEEGCGVDIQIVACEVPRTRQEMMMISPEMPGDARAFSKVLEEYKDRGIDAWISFVGVPRSRRGPWDLHNMSSLKWDDPPLAAAELGVYYDPELVKKWIEDGLLDAATIHPSTRSPDMVVITRKNLEELPDEPPVQLGPPPGARD